MEKMKSSSLLTISIRCTMFFTFTVMVLLLTTGCSGEKFLRAGNNNRSRKLLIGSRGFVERNGENSDSNNNNNSRQHLETPNELSSVVSSSTANVGLLRIDNEDIDFFNEYLEDFNSFGPPVTTNPPGIIPTSKPTTTSPTSPISTNQPTDKPSKRPTDAPTDKPTDQPTEKPTDEPTEKPTDEPTDMPTKSPTDTPTKSPTGKPTKSPTDTPSEMTEEPTEEPTDTPTDTPTVEPTTEAPSPEPVVAPTPAPFTAAPVTLPTPAPFTPPTPAPFTPPTPAPVSPPTPAPVTALVPTESPSYNNKCNLSPEGRVALINIFLRVVSNAIDMDTTGSPQIRALDWIINDDPMQLCPQDSNLIQRYVLAVFYFSTRGDRWTQCSAPIDYSEDQMSVQEANDMCNIDVSSSSSSSSSTFESGSNAWLTPETECSWGGLGCNENNDVVRIEMEQNGVAGTLPHELSRLQNLRNLVLEEGILTGTIPKELGEIQTLEQIDLNFNLLQGSIPEEIYNLENLRQMDLNDNELTGTISDNIGNLLQMSFFQIENNLFTGMVPSQMGSLVQLEVATMDNNQLSGTMPCTSMSALQFLQVLTADCLGAPNRPSPPLLVCECCTQCF